MRKLIVSNLISLDGYASGPGGDVMALPFDTTFSDYNLELMQTADTLVSGATTYRGFLNYLASNRRRPEPARSREGHLAPPQRARASGGLQQPYRRGDRSVAREDQDREQERGTDAIAQAKEGEGGTLLVFGSMTTWNGLLAAGLVNELHMMVGAGVLTDGVPAFSVPPPGPMQLTGARQLGDSNIALLQYSLGRLRHKKSPTDFLADELIARTCARPTLKTDRTQGSLTKLVRQLGERGLRSA
jgi:hypothetical protein